MLDGTVWRALLTCITEAENSGRVHTLQDAAIAREWFDSQDWK